MRRAASRHGAGRARDTRRARGAAVTGVLVLALGLGGVLGGCSAHQGPAAPGERPEQGTGTESTVPVAPLPLPAPQPGAGEPPVRPGAGLDALDRDQIAQARRLGAQWVVMVVQTDPPRTEEATVALTALGGVVGTNHPGPDYLRVTMPVADAERAATAPGVTAADVTDVIPPNQPQPR